jgi:hypothetical protein
LFKDFWQGDHLLCKHFPQLFTYSLNEDVVKDMVLGLEVFNHFTIPISLKAHQELTELQ